MRQFSATDLANKTGDVLAAAAQGPVTIARYGKARFVVLSSDQFERLQQSGDARHAVHVSELDDAQADILTAVLQDSIDHD